MSSSPEATLVLCLQEDQNGVSEPRPLPGTVFGAQRTDHTSQASVHFNQCFISTQ